MALNSCFPEMSVNIDFFNVGPRFIAIVATFPYFSGRKWSTNQVTDKTESLQNYYFLGIIVIIERVNNSLFFNMIFSLVVKLYRCPRQAIVLFFVSEQSL